MIIQDDLTRFMCIYFLENKPEVSEQFKQFLSMSVMLESCIKFAVTMPKIFTSKEFTRHSIKCELTTAGRAAFNGVVEHALDNIEKESHNRACSCASHVPSGRRSLLVGICALEYTT